MSDREIQKHYLTRDEAVKYVKNKYRKGVGYYVSTETFIYTKTPEECGDGENSRGYRYPVCIKVSQSDAIKFICNSLQGKFIEEGCRILVSDHVPNDRYPGAMFIG